MINWSAFTWEAFATLVTGLAAVIAAVIVAIRQTRIVERQVQLQEFDLRSTLFDKRAKLYNAIRTYIGGIVWSGKWREPDFDTFSLYYDSIETCRFLFSKALYDELKGLESFIDESQTLNRRVTKGQYGDFQNEAAAQAELSRRFKELTAYYESLPVLFAHEMRIAVSDNHPIIEAADRIEIEEK